MVCEEIVCKSSGSVHCPAHIIELSLRKLLANYIQYNVMCKVAKKYNHCPRSLRNDVHSKASRLKFVFHTATEHM